MRKSALLRRIARASVPLSLFSVSMSAAFFFLNFDLEHFVYDRLEWASIQWRRGEPVYYYPTHVVVALMLVSWAAGVAGSLLGDRSRMNDSSTD